MILEAFTEAVRSTPIDRVTVADLARRTGLSRQTFYAHFEDKYQMSIAVFERGFAPVAAANRAGETTWLEAGIRHLAIYKADPAFYRNALSSYERCGLRFYLNERIYQEFLFKCLGRGLNANDPDQLFALRMYALSTNEVTFGWVEDGCVESEETIVRRFDLCRPLILSPYLEDAGSYTP